MPLLLPSERSELARLAAHVRWARDDPGQAAGHIAAAEALQTRHRHRKAKAALAEALTLLQLDASGLLDSGEH